MANVGSLNLTELCHHWSWRSEFVLPWIARVKIISLFPKMSSDYALGATIISDGLVGNTKIDPFKGNLSIGKDTIVSTRNFFFGLVPESNLDAWISTSQVKYDTDRLQGTK